VSRSLWLDPSFGASGDMLLGALVGLSADDTSTPGDAADVVERLVGALGVLGVDGWAIEYSPVTRSGITATRTDVSAEHGPARHWSDIDALLADSGLVEAVVTGARSTFRLLAEIEAAQHGVAIDEVHFHEVGAVDAIVDIVGAWWLLDRLGVDEVVVGPVGLGHGTVPAAHGALPIPAPATLELLRGAKVRSLDAPFETCTPTGAALLRSMGTWGPIPGGMIVAAGRGAGGKDPGSHPNVLTAVLVETAESGDGPEAAVVLTTNVDDVTPEVLGRVIDVLLAAGADDAWLTPITMKKGRPAHQVSALVAPAAEAVVRSTLSAETGTLGIRSTPVVKHVAPRRFDTVEVRGSTVRIKVGPHGAKAEHDDLVAIAERDGVPLRTVAHEAIAAWAARP
jgi:uncharacterized protein (TIGR00299 family) protein